MPSKKLSKAQNLVIFIPIIDRARLILRVKFLLIDGISRVLKYRRKRFRRIRTTESRERNSISRIDLPEVDEIDLNKLSKRNLEKRRPMN